MIIDRVKKRIETDLDDTELQLIIDEANQDIIDRFGPHANSIDPITVMVNGDRQKIVLDRAIDTTQDIVIVDYYDKYELNSITLQDDDYRIWPPGTIIERRFDGTGGSWEQKWGERVKFTYTPTNDGNKREEVIIKLIELAIEYGPYSSKSVGDVTESNLDYNEEREKLLGTLMPRAGLYMQ